MKTFDLTKHVAQTKKEIVFDAIELPTFSSITDAQKELMAAEDAYIRYRKMLPLVRQLDAINDDISANTPGYDLMIEDDYHETLEHNSLDTFSYMKDHLAMLVVKFKKYCDDIEAEIEVMEQDARDDEQYGSYEDQVRSTYYARCM